MYVPKVHLFPLHISPLTRGTTPCLSFILCLSHARNHLIHLPHHKFLTKASIRDCSDKAERLTNKLPRPAQTPRPRRHTTVYKTCRGRHTENNLHIASTTPVTMSNKNVRLISLCDYTQLTIIGHSHGRTACVPSVAASRPS